MKILSLITALLLAGCGLTPETLSNVAISHQAFPSLSVAVGECVADRPEVRAQIEAPWNRLVGKWAAADDLEPNAELLAVLAGAQGQVAEAKADWRAIKRSVVGAGIDCGPAVEQEVERIERTFAEIESAVRSNQRVVYVLQYAQVLSSIVTGRGATVTRL